MKKIPYIVLALIISLWGFPKMTIAEPYIKPFQKPVRVLGVQETISKYALLFGVSENEISQTIKCESSFNPKAIGDNGKARNVAQYHKPTFDHYSNQMGLDLDYNSYNDQIMLMAWQWKNVPQSKSEWTCYTKKFG